MIWHNRICANPRSVRRTLLPKPQKGFVDGCSRKKFSAIMSAGRYEIDWRSREHQLKAVQALLSIFGGHRHAATILKRAANSWRARQADQSARLDAILGKLSRRNLRHVRQ